jgi:hypothetical protein
VMIMINSFHGLLSSSSFNNTYTTLNVIDLISYSSHSKGVSSSSYFKEFSNCLGFYCLLPCIFYNFYYLLSPNLIL